MGVAVPYSSPTLYPEHAVMLEDDDLTHLAPPDDWLNLAPFPIKIFAPDAPDMIGPDVTPILEIPQATPVRIARNRRTDYDLTERFGIPVARTTYKEVIDPQFPDGETLGIIQQEAVRTYVKLGLPVRHLVVLGDVVRDNKGRIQGGRSLKVYQPEMLIRDPF